MIFNHKNHDFSEKKFGEARLVFVEQRQRDEDNSERFEFKKGVENHEFDLEKYKKHLDKAIQKGKVQESEKDGLLAVAQVDIERHRKEEERMKDDSLADKIREKLDSKEKRGDLKKIEKRAVKTIEKGEISDFRTLREFVRSEIEYLGVDFVDEKEEAAKAFLEFEERILERVQAVLETSRKHQKILDDAEKEKKQAARVWKKMKYFFTDPQRKDFLEFLKVQNFPSGEQFSINRLFEVSKKIEKNDGFEKSDMLLGTFDPLALGVLEDRLNAIERFYQNFEKNKNPDEKNIAERLRVYTHKLNGVHQEISANKILPPPIWQQIFASRQADIELAQKLLKKEDLFSRRFVATLLDEGEAQISELETLISGNEASREEEMRAEPREEDGEEEESSAEKTAKRIREFSSPPEEDKETAFGKFNSGLLKFMTANSRITWYSWYDITETFKGIREAMTKHMESVSEDKRGGLAKGLTFWRPVIQKRVIDADLAGERSRAEEEKKFYINKTDKQMIAELKTLPAMDKRRAILETLADRGSLDFENRELMKIITRDSIKEEDWTYADNTADYTLMKHAFSKAVDGWFIGEVGYGDKLIQMQVAGAKKGEDENKDKCDRYGSLSAASELNLLQATLEKGTIDGEYRFRGNIHALLGTGSAHSGNSSRTSVSLGIEGHETQKSMDADLGTVMVILVDAFLKGQISRENLMAFGLQHEGGMMAFAGIEDVLAFKDNKDEDGNPISKMYEYGWIAGKDGKGGTLTTLGVEQIRNYFNTRAAKTKHYKTDEEGYTHIASDNSTYVRHTQRPSSIGEMRSKGGVCDKFSSYFMKAAREDLYDIATRTDYNGKFQAEMTEIASLIKSCLEDIQDGIKIKNEGKDFATEMATGLKIQIDSNGEEYVEEKVGDGANAETVPRPPRGKKVSFGEERIERGSRNLLRMLKNLYGLTADRSITGQNGQYEGSSLEGFVKKKLKGCEGIPEYRAIIRNLERLTQDDTPDEATIQKNRKNRNEFAAAA